MTSDLDALRAALAHHLGLSDALTAQESLTLAALADALVARAGSPKAALEALAAPASASADGFLSTLVSGEHDAALVDDASAVSTEEAGRYVNVRRSSGELAELGRGGLGQVVAVADRFVGREVAMKQLLPKHLAEAAKSTQASAGLAARFLREARVTGQLEHPAIVPVFEIGRRPDGSLYYTMRRIQGRTLHAALSQAKTVAQRLRLVPAVLTVCQALAYAHSRDVLHRDVKPQNVMLGEYGETYLLDWGLARLKGAPEAAERAPTLAPDITGALAIGAVGTPAYMSPEQAKGSPGSVDERSDVWGLGVTLFEVLTGRLPFLRDSPYEVMTAILREDAPLARSLAPDVPAELEAICEKALRRDPRQRYATARELAADLEAWLSGRRVRAHRYTSGQLLGRFVRQNRSAVAVATAALVALATLGAVSWRRVQQKHEQTRDFARLMLGEVTERLSPEPESLSVIEAITQRAFAFYSSAGSLDALPPSERTQLGKAFSGLAEMNIRVGKVKEAREALDLCLRITGDATDAMARPLLGVWFGCTYNVGRVEQLQGRPEAADAVHLKLWDVVDRRGDEAPEDDDWQSALSLVWHRQSEWELIRNHHEPAERLARKAIAVEERLHVDPRRLMVVTAHLELMLWSFERPEEAVRAGERLETLADALTPSATPYRTLTTAASALRQHGMLLGWTADKARSRAALERAQRLLQYASALAPSDVVVLAELGDTRLELDDVEGAWAAYRRVGPGLKGDYLTSYALVALLAGEGAEVRQHLAALEAQKDPQGLWVAGVAQAQVGQWAEAARLLRGCAALDSALQVPRGALAKFAATQSPHLQPPLTAFFEGLAVGVGSADDAALTAAYEGLADAFEALGRGPQKR